MATCTWGWATAATPTTSGASHIEPGGNAQNLTHAARQDAADRPGESGPHARQSGSRQPQRPVPHSHDESLPRSRARCRRFTPTDSATRTASFDRLTGELMLADVGQNNIEEIDRVVLGGKLRLGGQGRHFLFNRTTGTGTAPAPSAIDSPGLPGRVDRSDLRSSRHARVRSRRRHLHHRRLRLPGLRDPRNARQVRLRRPGASQRSAARGRPPVLRRSRGRRRSRSSSFRSFSMASCPTG